MKIFNSAEEAESEISKGLQELDTGTNMNSSYSGNDLPTLSNNTISIFNSEQEADNNISGDLPISNVHETVNKEDFLTNESGPELEYSQYDGGLSDRVMELPRGEEITQNLSTDRLAPYEGYAPEEDNLPVQQALNGLFGDLGLAQEPLPQDPMMNMMQNSPMASMPGQQEMAGVYPIREDLMPMAVEVLSNSFTSLNESGILLSHQDRLAYATAVMKENTALPSTKKAGILNSFMKNGKIIPEILPPDWYISRGAQLKRQSQEKLMMAKNEQLNQQNPNGGM